MYQNIKDKFTLNITKYIDIKSKNKFYIKKINVNTDYYKENNYKFQSSEKIIKNLKKLIDKLNQKKLL